MTNVFCVLCSGSFVECSLLIVLFALSFAVRFVRVCCLLFVGWCLVVGVRCSLCVGYRPIDVVHCVLLVPFSVRCVSVVVLL